LTACPLTLSFWSHDIGGFLGNTGGDLLVRWMQLGMFCSHSRIHGSGDRELYKFDQRTFKLCREFIRLRYRLMPYILGTSLRSVADMRRPSSLRALQKMGSRSGALVTPECRKAERRPALGLTSGPSAFIPQPGV
ncbi:MAG: TIM-barrel domain-containing protein, partial [bacterium]